MRYQDVVHRVGEGLPRELADRAATMLEQTLAELLPLLPRHARSSLLAALPGAPAGLAGPPEGPERVVVRVEAGRGGEEVTVVEGLGLPEATLREWLQALQRGLFEEGVLALAIVFPTVARGKARIRTMPSAMHELKDFDDALVAFEKVGKKLGLIG